MPLVSIITPTWKRHELLARAIQSIQAQTFLDWEHIIVSDGPDNKELCNILATYNEAHPWNYKYVELGRNWKSFSGGGSPGAVPRIVGGYVASGQYIAYLDDDNAWRPNHLEILVKLISQSNLDCVYSSMQVIEGGAEAYVVGKYPPEYSQIDTNILLHRVELLKSTTWRTDFYQDDWQLVQEWVKQERKFGWINEITVDYYKENHESASL